MTRGLFLLSLCVATSWTSLRFGPCVAIARDEPAFDLRQPESPPRPLPVGIRFIDQGKLDPRLAGYRTPAGFRLEVVAEEPIVVNPVGMTFGPDGSLYVIEWRADADGGRETTETVRYRDGTTRSFAVVQKTVKDVVKRLRYNPEKGVYDRADVILEDALPSSVLVHDNYLYTSGRGTVRRWKLPELLARDRGRPQLEPEVIVRGFGGFHRHQVSGLTIGNDGLLYITSGDGDNVVEGSDGSRATVLRTGAVFRCRPDGSRVQVYSIGYRNPYRDIAMDAAGNFFHADDDGEDGSKFTGCRLMHVAEESDFGWRGRSGACPGEPDAVRAAVFGELPGKLPPLLKTGRGAPAGLLIYNDTGLPAYYRGLIYYPDVLRRLIRAYAVGRTGATFEVRQEFELLRSNDPQFRPCQMVVGPDGAIYVCDWRTDSGDPGQLSGDGKHGRIYRLTWAGGLVPGQAESQPAIPARPLDTWSRLAGPDVSLEKLREALGSPDGSIRLLAQREYLRRVWPKDGESGRPPTHFAHRDAIRDVLARLAADAHQPRETRVVALGALNRLWDPAVRKLFLERVLEDRDPEIRRLASDGLSLNCEPGDREAHDVLLAALSDPDPAARRAAALAMGRINAPGAADALVATDKSAAAGDVYLLDAYLRAIERTGKAGAVKLLELFQSGSAEKRAVAVDAFTRMRTRATAEVLPELLADPNTTAEQRVALIRSCTNYLLDPPVALDWLPRVIRRGRDGPEVELAAVDVLAECGQLRGAEPVNFVTGLLDHAQPGVRAAAVAVIEKARVTEAGPRVVQTLADAARPLDERTALVRTLRVLKERSAAPALREMLASAEPSGLRAEALRTLTAVDPDGAFAAARQLLDEPDPTLQAEVVQALGLRPEGASFLGERFVAKKLPRDLLPQVASAVRKHVEGDASMRKLLTDVMRSGLLQSAEPMQAEKVRRLVAEKGNPWRGKALYLNARVAKCNTCHRMEGAGGTVGPDLTRVWDLPLEKILESIIEPSREIREGFQTYRLTTRARHTYTGLKVSENADEVVIREATGKDVRVPRVDVEDLRLSKGSLMPDTVVAQLSIEEFIDLVAFLKSRSAQESFRVPNASAERNEPPGR